MSSSTIIGRYQDYRTRRFLANEERWSTWLPKWRTRSRRRTLVVALCAVYAFMFVVGVLCHFGIERAPVLWLPACLLFFPIWIAVQVVSGRRGDAPASTLDEWEIRQRNDARSIGFAVTQNLVLLAAAYTVVTAVTAPDGNPDWHYAAGIFTLVALLVGGTTPALILAWTRPDPVDEDN